MSRNALQRAGRIADGWLAQYSLEELSETHLSDGLAAIKQAGQDAGRPASELDGFRIVVRVTGADRKLDGLATRLATLAEAGATDVIVDVDWDGEDGPARSFDILRSAVA
jgi:alkanesulfonate monooxygenase SsuD/methylene tetrahydromethanopterin reductase-like flavin-dependent oxidoreductase (luciferase family)